MLGQLGNGNVLQIFERDGEQLGGADLQLAGDMLDDGLADGIDTALVLTWPGHQAGFGVQSHAAAFLIGGEVAEDGGKARDVDAVLSVFGAYSYEHGAKLAGCAPFGKRGWCQDKHSVGFGHMVGASTVANEEQRGLTERNVQLADGVGVSVRATALGVEQFAHPVFDVLAGISAVDFVGRSVACQDGGLLHGALENAGGERERPAVCEAVVGRLAVHHADEQVRGPFGGCVLDHGVSLAKPGVGGLADMDAVARFDWG